jgi:hypothetical protein
VGGWVGSEMGVVSGGICVWAFCAGGLGGDRVYGLGIRVW